ncbi:hypothetical protein BZA05DRAFT_386818 [Tricharina praecox]|uniref:uncharacterized protein n=1 Tax=Tricharina praecox TaxID=43433 RepID=UPI00221FC4BF|nr:uncharacterized protein BZA05DRAFT_386818 [Tricharina praecox]KAI5856968.1 hypothetical protein BZA05DRAFT_386818 [Tricharina praecox]
MYTRLPQQQGVRQLPEFLDQRHEHGAFQQCTHVPSAVLRDNVAETGLAAWPCFPIGVFVLGLIVDVGQQQNNLVLPISSRGMTPKRRRDVPRCHVFELGHEHLVCKHGQLRVQEELIGGALRKRVGSSIQEPHECLEDFGRDGIGKPRGIRRGFLTICRQQAGEVGTTPHEKLPMEMVGVGPSPPTINNGKKHEVSALNSWALVVGRGCRGCRFSEILDDYLGILGIFSARGILTVCSKRKVGGERGRVCACVCGQKDCVCVYVGERGEGRKRKREDKVARQRIGENEDE